MQDFLKIFSPNHVLKAKTLTIIVTFQVVLALCLWYMSGDLIPKPHEILKALSTVLGQGLLSQMLISTKLALHAILLATIISSLLSYATVMPFFRPITFIFTKFRYLPMVGLTFIFTLMSSGGYNLKLMMMLFGVTVFFVTNMYSIVKDIPREEYNYSRTLRMNEWTIVWYTVIRGRLASLIETLRQNFAICWMMITMVEGLVRTDGGVGVLLNNDNKHMALDNIFAIQLVIFFVGIGMDYLIGLLKNLICPESKLALERK